MRLRHLLTGDSSGHQWHSWGDWNSRAESQQVSGSPSACVVRVGQRQWDPHGAATSMLSGSQRHHQPTRKASLVWNH